MKRKILIMAATLGLSLALGVDAQPRGGGRGAGPAMGPPPDLTEKLNLNDAQQKAWEAIRADMNKSTESTRARLRELRDQGAGRDDKEVVEARATMQKAFAKAESDLMDILTDEQKTQYKELKKQEQSERGHGRGKGGPPGGQGRRGPGGPGAF